MPAWYKSKVKYQSLINGEIKTVTEHYLHDAVSFGDVELQSYEQLKARIKDPNVEAIALCRFNDVIFYNGTNNYEIDPFWHVKTQIESDEGKKITWQYLIPAQSIEEATERMLDYHKSTLVPVKVSSVVQTDILAVWAPHNELWQGDWHNRMEAMAELGRVSVAYNQVELFEDFDSKAKNAAQASTALVVQKTGLATREVEAVEAEDLNNGIEPEHYHEARLVEETRLIGSGESEGTPTDPALNANSEQKYPAGKAKAAKGKAKKEAKSPKAPKRPANRRGDWVSPSA